MGATQPPTSGKRLDHNTEWVQAVGVSKLPKTEVLTYHVSEALSNTIKAILESMDLHRQIVLWESTEIYGISWNPLDSMELSRIM